jgi:hypothetical protein
MHTTPLLQVKNLRVAYPTREGGLAEVMCNEHWARPDTGVCNTADLKRGDRKTLDFPAPALRGRYRRSSYSSLVTCCCRI